MAKNDPTYSVKNGIMYKDGHAVENLNAAAPKKQGFLSRLLGRDDDKPAAPVAPQPVRQEEPKREEPRHKASSPERHHTPVKKSSKQSSTASVIVEKIASVFSRSGEYEGAKYFENLGFNEKHNAPEVKVQTKSGFYEVDGRPTKVHMGKYGYDSEQGKFKLSTIEYLVWASEQNDQKDRYGNPLPKQTYDTPTLDGGITYLNVPDPKDPSKVYQKSINQLIANQYKMVIDGVPVDFGVYTRGGSLTGEDKQRLQELEAGARKGSKNFDYDDWKDLARLRLEDKDLTGRQKDAVARLKIAEKTADIYNEKRFGENFMKMDKYGQLAHVHFTFNVDIGQQRKDGSLISAVANGNNKQLASEMGDYTYSRALGGQVQELINRRERFDKPLAEGRVSEAIANATKYKGDEIERLRHKMMLPESLNRKLETGKMPMVAQLIDNALGKEHGPQVPFKDNHEPLVLASAGRQKPIFDYKLPLPAAIPHAEPSNALLASAAAQAPAVAAPAVLTQVKTAAPAVETTPSIAALKEIPASLVPAAPKTPVPAAQAPAATIVAANTPSVDKNIVDAKVNAQNTIAASLLKAAEVNVDTLRQGPVRQSERPRLDPMLASKEPIIKQSERLKVEPEVQVMRARPIAYSQDGKEVDYLGGIEKINGTLSRATVGNKKSVETESVHMFLERHLNFHVKDNEVGFYGPKTTQVIKKLQAYAKTLDEFKDIEVNGEVNIATRDVMLKVGNGEIDISKLREKETDGKKVGLHEAAESFQKTGAIAAASIPNGTEVSSNLTNRPEASKEADLRLPA